MVLLAVKISHFVLKFQNSIFLWSTVIVILEGFQSSSLKKQKSVKSKKKRFFYLSNSTTCTTVVFSISRFICLNVKLLVRNFHHFAASDWTKVGIDWRLIFRQFWFFGLSKKKIVTKKIVIFWKLSIRAFFPRKWRISISRLVGVI